MVAESQDTMNNVTSDFGRENEIDMFSNEVIPSFDVPNSWYNDLKFSIHHQTYPDNISYKAKSDLRLKYS